MALDKLVDSAQLDANLTSIADAIRTKGGTSASLAFPAGFVSAVEAIETGGGGDNADVLISGVYSGQTITSGATKLGKVFANTTGDFYVRLPNLLESNVTNMAEYSTMISFFAPLAWIKGNLAFQRNYYLKTVVIKQLSGYRNFENDSSLEVVDFTGNGGALNNVFQTGCGNLDTLIIRGNGVMTLSNTTTFTSTPFASGGSGGTLYVPSALISSYQAATNWSTILGYSTNSIQAIEGSIYETQYADGTAIT